jgi:hypothetical protein
VTVGDVAVCAVLAGCAPAHLPALVAGVRAVQDPAFNLLGVSTTTGSAAIAMILHGSAVQTLGANAGANCLGPGNHTNATLGRALATVVRAVGGAVPGSIDMATMGQPAKYGMCCAEGDPFDGWPPLHTERGFAPSDPAVTVYAPSGTIEVVDATSHEPEGLLATLAGALGVRTGSDGRAAGSGEPVVLVPPEWALRLSAAGWTRAAVRERLARRPEGARPTEALTLVVTGGVGTKAIVVPSWSGGTRSVTAGIAPPS